MRLVERFSEYDFETPVLDSSDIAQTCTTNT
jgi:hypothetical protein